MYHNLPKTKIQNLKTSLSIIFAIILVGSLATTSLKTASASSAVDPNYVAALNNKGSSLAKLGRPAEAIQYYDKALAVDPNDVAILSNKCNALDDLDRPAEAIQYCDKALAVDPNYVEALNGKGIALDDLGRPAEAIQYYDKALAIDPNFAKALYNKGNSLAKRGKYEEAIQYYDKALAIDPNYVNALGNKGAALDDLGKYEEAIQYLDKVLAIDPNYVAALNNKGGALAKLGRLAEAIQYFDKALAIDPSNANALKNKNLVLSKLGKNGESSGGNLQTYPVSGGNVTSGDCSDSPQPFPRSNAIEVKSMSSCDTNAGRGTTTTGGTGGVSNPSPTSPTPITTSPSSPPTRSGGCPPGYTRVGSDGCEKQETNGNGADSGTNAGTSTSGSFGEGITGSGIANTGVGTTNTGGGSTGSTGEPNMPTLNQQQQPSYSVADELTKLVDLRNQGIISEEEFGQLKNNLIKSVGISGVNTESRDGIDGSMVGTTTVRTGGNSSDGGTTASDGIGGGVNDCTNGDTQSDSPVGNTTVKAMNDCNATTGGTTTVRTGGNTSDGGTTASDGIGVGTDGNGNTDTSTTTTSGNQTSPPTTPTPSPPTSPPTTPTPSPPTSPPTTPTPPSCTIVKAFSQESTANPGSGTGALELSGSSWISKFPGSKNINDLEPDFRINVQKFVDALTASGTTPDITATKRPEERAYLMHWAWRIVKENYNACNVPPKAGVNINWWHGDQAKSKAAAQEMVNGYGINNLQVAPSLTSRHIEGKAIDMVISWTGNLKIKNADGSEVIINSLPRDGTNAELIKVGKTYDVIHFTNVNKDKPHWSTDGH